MRTRSLSLTALVAALLLLVAVPAGAAGPGTPRTWGGNSFGELGNGTTTSRFSAGPVTGLDDATELGGGREHVVALRADGSVWAWGSSQYGQQGNGGTANRPAPGPVAGLAGVVQVAAGHYHSLALLGDGTVCAWGMNSQSQLGDGTRTRRACGPTPPPSSGSGSAARPTTTSARCASGSARGSWPPRWCPARRARSRTSIRSRPARCAGSSPPTARCPSCR